METDRDDELMEILRKLNQGKKSTMVINEDKVALVKKLYQITENITTGAKVSLTLFKPFPNMGCISVEGKRPVFEDTGLFAEIAKCASNFNAYSLTNGKVRIDFTFYGLRDTKKGESVK